MIALSFSAQARETVHFYAWGGSAQINGYFQWVKEQVDARYDIDLVHVKLAATSDAVSQVLAEKSAGNDDKGTVDLLWVNGENFASMSEHGLLKKHWVEKLPNNALTNPENNPALRFDFGVPTQGQEAPWGRAAMVFYYNQEHISQPPQTIEQLMDFATQNPGRFTYPVPRDFLGITFLKYALIALNEEHQDWLLDPVTDERFNLLAEPLWEYLDQLHPYLWRQGRYFVENNAQMQRLYADSSVLLGFNFNAAEIPSAVERFDIPETTRTYAMDDGALANVHFVAISYNTKVFDEAQTVVNFLLSPEAQAHKQRLDIWGDDSVLDLNMLSEEQKLLFSEQSHPSAIDKSQFKKLLAEPHPSWGTLLRQTWYERYGSGQ
jgi:putative thiamine transport system substrate-binding protein